MPEAAVADRDQIRRHLEALYEAACDSGYRFGIFTLPDRRCAYYESPEDAVGLCAEAAEGGLEVYCTMGVVRELSERLRTTPGARAGKAEVEAVVAMWADIDIAGDGHQAAKPYPATAEAALEVARVGGLEPSVWVHSGGGVHAYHLLDEPREIASDAAGKDRDAVSLLAHRWGGSVQARARERGYEVDATHDLGRVLRVAGTLNHKGDTPRPVVLHGAHAEPTRYSLDDLEHYMIAPEYIRDGARVIDRVAEFAIDPNVRIPEHSIKVLFSNMPEAKDTWEMEREFADQSPSTYDMALANLFVRLGFDDQQIVDYLVFWRREVAKAPKNRIDYYQRTIGKARGAARHEKAVERFAQGHADLPDVADPANVSQSDRESAVSHLRDLLGIRIERFVQVDRDDGELYIVLDDGEQISCGPSIRAMKFHNLRARIAERCGVVLSSDIAKSVTWDRVLQTLYAIREQDDSLEPRTEDRMRELIEGHIAGARAYDGDELERYVREGDPIVRAGQICIYAPRLQTYIQTTGARVTAGEVRRDLRLLGFTQRRIDARASYGVRTTRRYWCAPADDWPVDHSPPESGGDDDERYQDDEWSELGQ